MGKGRQIAAMIKEEHARGGTRVLWLSVSNDLRFDAERDLADVGAGNITVFPQVMLCVMTQGQHCCILDHKCDFVGTTALLDNGGQVAHMYGFHVWTSMHFHVHAIIKFVRSPAHATTCGHIWTLANPQAEI